MQAAWLLILPVALLLPASLGYASDYFENKLEESKEIVDLFKGVLALKMFCLIDASDCY